MGLGEGKGEDKLCNAVVRDHLNGEGSSFPHAICEYSRTLPSRHQGQKGAGRCALAAAVPGEEAVTLVHPLQQTPLSLCRSSPSVAELLVSSVLISVGTTGVCLSSAVDSCF